MFPIKRTQIYSNNSQILRVVRERLFKTFFFFSEIATPRFGPQNHTHFHPHTLYPDGELVAVFPKSSFRRCPRHRNERCAQRKLFKNWDADSHKKTTHSDLLSNEITAENSCLHLALYVLLLIQKAVIEENVRKLFFEGKFYNSKEPFFSFDPSKKELL